MAITAGTPVVASASSNLTITLTAGRSVCVSCVWEGNSGVNGSTINAISFTGAGNGNATLIGSPRASGNGRVTTVQLAYLANVSTGGSTTVSVTWTGGSPVGGYWLTAVEFAGADTATFYDACTVTGADSPNTDTITLTTVSNNDLIFAYFTSGGQTTIPTIANYTGYTGAITNAHWTYGYYRLDAGAAGNNTISTGNTNANQWVWAAAGFKVAAVAGGIPKTTRLALMGVG